MLIAGSSVDILSSTKRNGSNSRILKKFVSLVLQLVLIILQHLALTVVLHHITTYTQSSDISGKI